MPYTYCYRIPFDTAAHANQPSGAARVDIWDTQNTDTATAELTGVSFREHIENLGEERYGVKGRRFTVQFLSTQSVNVTTFCAGDDNRFFVDAYFVSTGERIFQGFLVQDDISESFMDAPNVVTLTAGDGLGLLKDEPLINWGGSNPRGHYTIREYVSMCLLRTGLSLPINVVDNIREESDPTQTWYNTVYAEAKTWERDINTSISGYDVLSKILGEQSFLVQYNAAWWIVRVDEYDQPTARVNQYQSDGTFLGTTTADLNLVIGLGEKMYFAGGATRVTPRRAWKHVKETYPYEYPKELINNIDFSRGTLVSTTPVADNDQYDEERRYTLDEFTARRRYSDGSTTGTEEIDVYIVRRIKAGQEKQRFLEITPPSSSASPWHHIESDEGTPMMAKDKFTFSVDFRFDSDISGTGGVSFDLGHIRLEGTDGSVWTCDQNGYWVEAPQHRELGTSWAREDQTETDWQSYSLTVQPLPVDGKLFYALYSGQLTEADGGLKTVHYQNWKIDYTPFINGGYGEYTGQYHLIAQDIDSKAVREKEVGLSDSPRPLFKGALKVHNGTTYVLAGNFYNGAVFPVGLPNAEYLHPYGHLQAFDVWNQGNRLMRTFDVSVKGIRVEGALPGLIHRYRLSDTSPHTTGKYYQLLSGTFDWGNASWEGMVVEVYDTLIGKRYDDTHEFKYVEGR